MEELGLSLLRVFIAFAIRIGIYDVNEMRQSLFCHLQIRSMVDVVHPMCATFMRLNNVPHRSWELNCTRNWKHRPCTCASYRKCAGGKSKQQTPIRPGYNARIKKVCVIQYNRMTWNKATS